MLNWFVVSTAMPMMGTMLPPRENANAPGGVGREPGDVLRATARMVHHVVPEELPRQEHRALLVDGADPGRAVEGDHALPHVLLRDAGEGGRIDDGHLADVIERDADVVDGLKAEDRLRERLVG